MNDFHFFALVRQSTALSPAAQHAMFWKLGGAWETECFNTVIYGIQYEVFTRNTPNLSDAWSLNLKKENVYILG